MTNPLISPVLFGGYVIVLILITIIACNIARNKWLTECDRLRERLHKELGTVATDDFGRISGVLAIIPCQRRSSGSNEWRHTWLSFLEQRAVVIDSESGKSTTVSINSLRKLTIISKSGSEERLLQLEAEKGKMQILVERLDDMVRVINICIKHGIVIGFRRN